jgi:hypothetical protein
MKNFLSKMEPTDLIAIIVIVGGLILKFSGADGLVGTLLTAIVFFYFGEKSKATGRINQALKHELEQHSQPPRA